MEAVEVRKLLDGRYAVTGYADTLPEANRTFVWTETGCAYYVEPANVDGADVRLRRIQQADKPSCVAVEP